MSQTRRDVKAGIVKKGDLRKKKKSKLERVSESMSFVNVHTDDEGRLYVNHCTFQGHPGVIGDTVFEKKGCYVNNCPYYRKLVEYGKSGGNK